MEKYIIIIPIAGVLTVALLFLIMLSMIKFSDKYINKKEEKNKKEDKLN
ncbi:hypothetical protein Q2T46_07135 [Thermoanaerobacterium sp. CMT5567-10]|nr:hypothetical protein [Thermoanaerobacterium sp. CMT5567-10]WKV10199.2 hypothetical protein Q2T46_07135 [Thermoanaerobacterium sp. CMT5567-10]